MRAFLLHWHGLMMSKHIVCCRDCYLDIKENSDEQCAALWMNICSIVYARKSTIFGTVTDYPDLLPLEQLGYIQTRDVKDEILIKLMGSFCEIQGIYHFCLHGGDHEDLQDM